MFMLNILPYSIIRENKMALKLYYFVLYFVLAVYISLINGNIINIKHNSATVSLRFILITLIYTQVASNQRYLKGSLN